MENSPNLTQTPPSDSIEAPPVPNERQKGTQDQWFGLNRNLYRDRQGQFPVKTGPDHQILLRHPEFINDTYQQEELFTPKVDILEEALKRDVQTLCFIKQMMNQVVYDFPEQFPPQSKETDPASHGVEILPQYLPTGPADTTLIFESRFQCGNLRRVIRMTEFQYHLILRTDLNTNGHTQWYFFSVANTRKDVEYRFSIINLMKPESLYNNGMKPLFYSQKKANQKSKGIN